LAEHHCRHTSLLSGHRSDTLSTKKRPATSQDPALGTITHHTSSHRQPTPLSPPGALRAGLCPAGPCAGSEVGFRGHSVTPPSSPVFSFSKQTDILFRHPRRSLATAVPAWKQLYWRGNGSAGMATRLPAERQKCQADPPRPGCPSALPGAARLPRLPQAPPTGCGRWARPRLLLFPSPGIA